MSLAIDYKAINEAIERGEIAPVGGRALSIAKYLYSGAAAPLLFTLYSLDRELIWTDITPPLTRGMDLG